MPRPYSLTSYHPNIYLPDGWDSGWQQAKANKASAPLQLNIIGDSVSIGTNSSWTASFATQLVAKLQATYGHFGDFFAALHSYNGPAVTPGWSAGVSVSPYSDGYGNNLYSSSTASAACATFTTPYACTAFDFLWFDDPGFHAQWGYSVDSGATTLTTGPNDNKLHRIAFSGLANASHTFAWGWQTSNANCMAQGICTYVPAKTTGLFAARFDGSGATVQNMSGFQGANPKNLSGYPNGGHLTIFELSINDISTGTSVTNFTQYTDQAIRNLRAAYANSSIAFVIPSMPNATTDDCNPSGTGNNQTAILFHQAIYQLASHHSCAVFDVHARWGSTPHAQGFLSATDLHPLVAGQNDIFSFISPYIS